MNTLYKYKDIILSHSIRDLVNYDWNKIVFGFSSDDIITIPIDTLKIKWHTDMKNVIGYDMKKYFDDTDINKLPPIEVSFDGKQFYIEDGHHRYGYYKQLGYRQVPVKVDITANPYKFLGFTIDDVVNYKKTLTPSINESILFNTFLDKLDNIYNRSLIEAIKTGYKTIFEVAGYSKSSISDEFLNKYDIDEDDLDYLGSGDFGTAYSIGNGKVLKITSSKSEARLANEIMNGKFSSFVNIYVVEEHNGDYYIIQEELEEDSDIENLWYEVEEALQSQGLPVQYISNFDEDEYIEQGGELSDDAKSLMNDLWGISSDYRRLGVEASDIRPENIGRASDGTWKAFDIDDRQHLMESRLGDEYFLKEGDRIIRYNKKRTSYQEGTFIKYLKKNNLVNPKRAIIHIDGMKNPVDEWLYNIEPVN